MEGMWSEFGVVIAAVGAMAILLFVQLLVADAAGIRAGHVPGSLVPADHASFHFRATRAHANTNENIAIFILLVLFGVLSSADPAWLGGTAWSYVAFRVIYAGCYYANWKPARSVAFALSLLALLGMLGAGLEPWL